MNHSESKAKEMDQRYRVRPARSTDLDAIVEFNDLMATETEGRRLDVPTLRAGAQRCLADPEKGRYYMAEFDGKPIGQTLITREWSDWRNGWFWWIQSVYVHQEHRRRGVFRLLYERVAADAGSAGDVCGIRLYVEKENRGAINTYAQLGMTATSYLLLETDWSASK